MTTLSDTIFSTIHGSHLYGLDHSESDTDYFIVTSSRRGKARHHFDQELSVDTCTVGLNTFIDRINAGSHQSVEALFSPYKSWNMDNPSSMIRTYLENFRVTGSEVFAKYERTIHRFCFGDFKRRRHAIRLYYNLAGLRAAGRFDPVMTMYEKDTATHYARHLEGDELWNSLMGRTLELS